MWFWFSVSHHWPWVNWVWVFCRNRCLLEGNGKLNINPAFDEELVNYKITLSRNNMTTNCCLKTSQECLLILRRIKQKSFYSNQCFIPSTPVDLITHSTRNYGHPLSGVIKCKWLTELLTKTTSTDRYSVICECNEKVGGRRNRVGALTGRWWIYCKWFTTFLSLARDWDCQGMLCNRFYKWPINRILLLSDL